MRTRGGLRIIGMCFSLPTIQASRVIADTARIENVSQIHAASNHFNALPALLAARMLGIPFHYEMRGLWELTRASRQPWYENSARFHRTGA